jgi:hypothetical protein
MSIFENLSGYLRKPRFPFSMTIGQNVVFTALSRLFCGRGKSVTQATGDNANWSSSVRCRRLPARKNRRRGQVEGGRKSHEHSRKLSFLIDKQPKTAFFYPL